MFEAKSLEGLFLQWNANYCAILDCKIAHILERIASESVLPDNPISNAYAKQILTKLFAESGKNLFSLTKKVLFLMFRKKNIILPIVTEKFL